MKLWGVKQPQETQMLLAKRLGSARALWAIKQPKDNRREEFYDPARKDNILGRKYNAIGAVEEHPKDLIVALVKAQKCVEDQY